MRPLIRGVYTLGSMLLDDIAVTAAIVCMARHLPWQSNTIKATPIKWNWEQETASSARCVRR
jgi:hypothetical protein